MSAVRPKAAFVFQTPVNDGAHTFAQVSTNLSIILPGILNCSQPLCLIKVKRLTPISCFLFHYTEFNKTKICEVESP